MSATQNRKHTKLEIWTSMEKHNWKLEHGFSFLLLKNLNNQAHTTIASVTVFILNYRIITFKHTYIHTYIYIYIYIYIERERERERERDFVIKCALDGYHYISYLFKVSKITVIL